MKVRFPCYTTSFPCICTAQESTKRIMETVACQKNNFKIIGVYYTGVHKIVLRTGTGGYLYYNSFMPLVTIEIRELNSRVQVSVLFELQKSTKVLMTIFYVLAMLYEISLLALWMTHRLATLELLFFPLVTSILSYMLCVFGLFSSSKKISKILFVGLSRMDEKLVPLVHKFNQIG